MKLCSKQVSSLEKIRSVEDLWKASELFEQVVLAGERISYQITVAVDEKTDFLVQIKSELEQCINVYCVKNTIMDLPCYAECEDPDFITKKRGEMPDLLLPIKKQNNMLKATNGVSAIWVEIDIPCDCGRGDYIVDIELLFANEKKIPEIKHRMKLSAIGAVLPKQELIYTQWFHVDCIADYHGVEIYSEEHWSLIDKYLAMASRLGVNMILTPIITPPLDTAKGHMRQCTQLVEIEVKEDTYHFNFELLDRWIELCKQNGIEYFEMAHLFSQWGLEYTPSIYATCNGKREHIFGWDISAKDEKYREFLCAFLPKLKKFLSDKGIWGKCYFHLSDEPENEHLEAYRYAYELVKPLLGECKMIDALSNVSFYEKGLVEIPVPGINCLPEFIEKQVKHRWCYYCCGNDKRTSNRFLAMPSYRNRIIGLQMYKFDVEGFLHWGFNFYFSEKSMYSINPYVTTSADSAFPSGDAFSVYPGDDDVYPSLRAAVFYEAIQDICVCNLLETIIGREAVIKMIDKYAKMDVTVFEYPKRVDYIPQLMQEMKKIIGEHQGK